MTYWTVLVGRCLCGGGGDGGGHINRRCLRGSVEADVNTMSLLTLMKRISVCYITREKPSWLGSYDLSCGFTLSPSGHETLRWFHRQISKAGA